VIPILRLRKKELALSPRRDPIGHLEMDFVHLEYVVQVTLAIHVLGYTR
jgi:hypothetical protein